MCTKEERMTMLKRILFIFCLLLQTTNASELVKKKFEWGAGLLNLYGNHYRGSDQGRLWTFPLPYFNYSSDRIEVDPSFIRGIIFHNEWFSFKLSLMAGPNAESKKNRARAGMPSLDYTLEAGPMMVFYLWKSDNKEFALNFEWPFREVMATDFSYLKHVGLFTVPYLNLKHEGTPATWNWRSELSVSPMFADQKYHEYFYGVDKQFVLPNRPSYHARGGYSGLQTTVFFNKRIGNLIIIPVVRWDYLNGATFMNSPLVKIKNYLLAGLGTFWLFD